MMVDLECRYPTRVVKTAGPYTQVMPPEQRVIKIEITISTTLKPEQIQAGKGESYAERVKKLIAKMDEGFVQASSMRSSDSTGIRPGKIDVTQFASILDENFEPFVIASTFFYFPLIVTRGFYFTLIVTLDSTST